MVALEESCERGMFKQVPDTDFIAALTELGSIYTELKTSDNTRLESELYLEPHRWYDEEERALFVSCPSGLWHKDNRKRFVVELAVRIGRVNNCLKSPTENE